ncbi:hypothetical protein MPSEU_000449100 [Mayamaea pseudoterrestris]|nr:hypothetical protein MPSEU_000449100 [Mayamaea pseudoterrestris]
MSQSTAAAKRLRKELQVLQKQEADSHVFLRIASTDNLLLWKAWIKGPEDTPYEGGVFELVIRCGSDYPLAPPSIVFCTKIFHPNVHFRTGEICLDILKKECGVSNDLKESSSIDDTPVVAKVLESGDSSKPDIGGEGESRPDPAPVAEDNPDTPGASSNEPDIDFEAAYHAWQAAHAQAEQSAMDQQVKTVRTCCSSILQLIIVCCIVGKLQDSSEGESGYDALWIIFPVFLITGIVLGCCSCFIYSANPDSVSIITERTKKDHEGDSNAGDNTSQGHQDQSTAVAVAPKAETETTHFAGDEEAADATTDTDQVETAPDGLDRATMDDLD